MKKSPPTMPPNKYTPTKWRVEKNERNILPNQYSAIMFHSRCISPPWRNIYVRIDHGCKMNCGSDEGSSSHNFKYIAGDFILKSVATTSINAKST
jgi:hypothetical protein